MKFITIIFTIAFACIIQAQPVLKIGDPFPSIIIRNIINAPIKQYDVQAQNTKLLILNFWGTWCSPCLPEMDSLSVLQVKNKAGIQVIGISDEPTGRLKNYLARRPSSVWLASDTTLNLYRQFGFNYVGQSAIINKQNRIVALVRTDSINQQVIDRLLHNDAIPSSAETGNKAENKTDLFAVDSTTGYQVLLSSYRPGVPSMSKSYLKTSFEGRRLTYVNICLTNIYQDAYQVSNKQVIYEISEKEVCNWNDKSTLYCFDLVVKPEQKDSLHILLRQTIGQLAPVKARLEKRTIPVYILRRLPGAPEWPVSVNQESTFSFSGRGFKGKAIKLAPLVDYISNELEFPVVNETGLSGRYDIAFENELRTKEDMMAALKKLGLMVEKMNREMDVVIIYR